MIHVNFIEEYKLNTLTDDAINATPNPTNKPIAWDLTNVMFPLSLEVACSDYVQNTVMWRLPIAPPTEKAWIFKVVPFYRAYWYRIAWRDAGLSLAEIVFRLAELTRKLSVGKAEDPVCSRLNILSNVVVKITNTAWIKIIDLCSHLTWTPV